MRPVVQRLSKEIINQRITSKSFLRWRQHFSWRSIDYYLYVLKSRTLLQCTFSLGLDGSLSSDSDSERDSYFPWDDFSKEKCRLASFVSACFSGNPCSFLTTFHGASSHSRNLNASAQIWNTYLQQQFALLRLVQYFILSHWWHYFVLRFTKFTMGGHEWIAGQKLLRQNIGCCIGVQKRRNIGIQLFSYDILAQRAQHFLIQDALNDWCNAALRIAERLK